MSQFDVYRIPDGPLVVDCQTDLLNYLQSRFVVPLLPPPQANRKRVEPTRAENRMFTGSSFIGAGRLPGA